MVSPGLPTNIDATYPDIAEKPTTKIHQGQHDVVHLMVNRLDNANGVNGAALVWSSTGLYQALSVTVLVRWSGTAWAARPTGSPFGVLFLSTNDAAAPAPSSAGLLVGDLWRRHPNAAALA